MNKALIAVLAMILTMLNAVNSANASLLIIGTATYQGSDYQLIYDVEEQITWLDYSSPATGGYAGALAWTAGLNNPAELVINLDPDYIAYWNTTEWRLPTAEGNWGYWTNEQYITSTEMQFLYYDELGNILNDPSINISPFENIVTDISHGSYYYLKPNFNHSPTYVPAFNFNNGSQRFVTSSVNGGIYAMGVRSGEVVVGSEPVQFVDANLKLAVENEVGIINPTHQEILGLITLDANGKNISSLQGLEYAANLEVLHVGQNNISDISPLAGLTKLRELELYSNALEDDDMHNLALLTQLSSLHLNNNNISDLSPLLELTNLNYLELYGNLLERLAYCHQLPVLRNNNPRTTILCEPNPYSPDGDCNDDCRVNLLDVSVLSDQWAKMNCGECSGADLSGDSDTDMDDLEVLVLHWLECDALDCP